MSTNSWRQKRNGPSNPAWLIGALLACVPGPLIQAQEFAASSAEPSQSVWTPPAQAIGIDGVPAGGDEASPDEHKLQWGILDLDPHALYRLLYGNGILARPGHQTNTTEQDFSPGVEFSIGHHLALDYTPTWTFYSSKELKDSVAHSALLTDQTHYEDLDLRISQSYNKSSEPLVETGRQTNQQNFITLVDGAVQLGGAWALDTTLRQEVRLADDFATTRDWSITEGLNYQIEPGLTASGTLGYGYVSIAPGPNMTYLRPQAQVSWRVVHKVLLTAHAGWEDRKFIGAEKSHLHNPVYGLSAEYRPFENTTVNVEADRAVVASYFVGEVIESRRWGLSLNQRLLEKLNLSVGYERLTASYVSSLSAELNGRSDISESLNARLSLLIRRRLTVALLYQNIRNSSSVSDFSFSLHEVGLEVGYRY